MPERPFFDTVIVAWLKFLGNTDLGELILVSFHPWPFRKLIKDPNMIRIMLATALAFSLASTLSACVEIDNNDFADGGDFQYWSETDSFTNMKGSYLDASGWIDREAGNYLQVQFQCFNNVGSEYPTEYHLLINPKNGEYPEDSRSPTFGAVLYKRDNQDVQIYHQEWSGERLTNFKGAKLDVYSIFQKDEYGNFPKEIIFRLVYGVLMSDAESEDSWTLARSPSVDVKIASTNPESKKFLTACAS